VHLFSLYYCRTCAGESCYNRFVSHVVFKLATSGTGYVDCVDFIRCLHDSTPTLSMLVLLNFNFSIVQALFVRRIAQNIFVTASAILQIASRCYTIRFATCFHRISRMGSLHDFALIRILTYLCSRISVRWTLTSCRNQNNHHLFVKKSITCITRNPRYNAIFQKIIIFKHHNENHGQRKRYQRHIAHLSITGIIATSAICRLYRLHWA